MVHVARAEALRDAADKKETGVFSSRAPHFSKLPNEGPNYLPAKCFFTLSLGGCGKKTDIRLALVKFSNFSICGNLSKIKSHFVPLKYFFGSFEKRHALSLGSASEQEFGSSGR